MTQVMIFAPIDIHDRRDIENTLGNVYASFEELERQIEGVIYYSLTDAQDLINDDDDDVNIISDRMKSNWASFVFINN
jgi:uncharacterized protein YbcV (DUF1398 family)